MPSCRITNYTSQPLNVSLKHLCALHFENEVAPGQTVKLKPGRVWFTLEVLVDNKDNRYSVAQSAAAIAIVSLACVGTAAAAIPAAAALGGATVGTTIGTTIGTTVSNAVVAGGTGLIVAGETMLAGFGAAYTAASAFLGAHAVTAAKLSAAFLPKAIEVVEKEVGGFNAVQKEVIAILSSPSVTEDVRNEGLSILSRLGLAVVADREAAAAAAAEEEKEKEKEKEVKSGPSHERDTSNSSSDSGSSSGSNTLNGRPSLKRMQTSVSTLMHKLSSESRAEKKVAKQEAKEAKQVASWEVVDLDESCMLSSKERLRIHGLFMNERRHFEVREKEGKLVLMDANTKEVVIG